MDRASARISVQLRMVSGPVNLNSSKASARFLWPASRARPLINMRSIVNLFLVAFAIHEPPLPPSLRRNRADKRGSGRSNRFPLYFSISSLLLPPRLRRFPGSTEPTRPAKSLYSPWQNRGIQSHSRVAEGEVEGIRVGWRGAKSGEGGN